MHNPPWMNLKKSDMIPHKNHTIQRNTYTHSKSTTIMRTNYNSKFKIGLPLGNDGKKKPRN